MRLLVISLFLSIPLSVSSQSSIFATISGGNLYKVKINSCTIQFVGSTGQGFGDIAFTSDGKLWGISGGQLYQIDTITANTTLIGDTGVGAVSLVELNDSILLAEYNQKLYGINSRNATSYYIGTIGYQATGDLTWYDHDLYMSSAEQLIKMVLNGTNTALLSVDIVNSSNNPIPSCEGLATAPIPGDYNAILGFNGPNVYKICPLDGSSQLLCPNLITNGTPGAASLRLPVQLPAPASCKLTPTIELKDWPLSVEVTPNPFSYETTITTTENLKEANLTLFNATGQGVMQMNGITGKSIHLQRSNLPCGVYLLRLSQDNKVYTLRKVVISD